jgi:Ca-activated chloride channel homolog
MTSPTALRSPLYFRKWRGRGQGQNKQMRYQHKPLLSLLWLVPLVALADTDPFVAAGNLALQNNQPEEALAQYQGAEATLPNNPDLAFNKGGALYAQKKYKEAATEFLAATSSRDNKQRAEAYRHYGDALFRQEDLNGAIQAYEQALTLYPEDTVAAHNLEVALSKQQEQKEQPQSQESQDQSQPQSQNSQSQPSSQKSQENQENKDQKEPQDGQSGQENKDQQEEKEQSAQSEQEKQDEQKKKEQQAQQAQQAKEQQPNEPQDKLLDALRAKEKSFHHAKQKGKGNAQPTVSKDW